MSETGYSGVDGGGPRLPLSALFDISRRRGSLETRVAEPGRVVAYDAATQRADVACELLTVVRGATQVDAQTETPLPPRILQRVPVIWPRTAAGYVTLPLVTGDTGLLVFCDRSLERWKTAGTPDAPADARAHSMADGVFIPGLHADTTPITPPTSLVATVVEGPQIWLGATPTLGVVGGTPAATGALQAAVIALQTIVATPVPEPPLPGAGAAIDALAAALLPLLQALAVSATVRTKP